MGIDGTLNQIKNMKAKIAMAGRRKDGTGRMEQQWMLAVTIGLAVACAPLQAAETIIELKNPGFEEVSGSDESLPAGWQGVFSTVAEGDGIETTGVLKRDVTEAFTGEASAYLRTEGPRYVRFRQAVELYPGTRYRLSCWVLFKSRSTGDLVSVALRGRTTNDKRWSFSERAGTSGAGDWSQLVTEFTADEDARRTAFLELRILFATAPVEVWFDDIELVEIID